MCVLCTVQVAHRSIVHMYMALLNLECEFVENVLSTHAHLLPLPASLNVRIHRAVYKSTLHCIMSLEKESSDEKISKAPDLTTPVCYIYILSHLNPPLI